MAGLNAGLVSSTWPHMVDGGIIIPNDLSLWVTEHEATIHFIHRWIAFAALVMVVAFAVRVQSFALGGIVFVQFGLGIATVMTYVSIPIAAAHQAGAFILIGLMLVEMYRLRRRVQ